LYIKRDDTVFVFSGKPRGDDIYLSDSDSSSSFPANTLPADSHRRSSFVISSTPAADTSADSSRSRNLMSIRSNPSLPRPTFSTQPAVPLSKSHDVESRARSLSNIDSPRSGLSCRPLRSLSRNSFYGPRSSAPSFLPQSSGHVLPRNKENLIPPSPPTKIKKKNPKNMQLPEIVS